MPQKSVEVKSLKVDQESLIEGYGHCYRKLKYSRVSADGKSIISFSIL